MLALVMAMVSWDLTDVVSLEIKYKQKIYVTLQINVDFTISQWPSWVYVQGERVLSALEEHPLDAFTRYAQSVRPCVVAFAAKVIEDFSYQAIKQAFRHWQNSYILWKPEKIDSFAHIFPTPPFLRPSQSFTERAVWIQWSF